MSLYDDVAGTLDHLAGSTDEAVGGAVEDAQNGDWFRAGQDDAGAIDHAMGNVDEWMAGGTSDDVIDTVFTGHAGDTIDVFGPSTSDVADEVTQTPGEQQEELFALGDWLAGNWKLALGGAVILYAMSVTAPYVEAAN